LLQHVSVQAGTIIREPKSVPIQNYSYGSTVLFDMWVISVLVAYYCCWCKICSCINVYTHCKYVVCSYRECQ